MLLQNELTADDRKDTFYTHNNRRMGRIDFLLSYKVKPQIAAVSNISKSDSNDLALIEYIL